MSTNLTTSEGLAASAEAGNQTSKSLNLNPLASEYTPQQAQQSQQHQQQGGAHGKGKGNKAKKGGQKGKKVQSREVANEENKEETQESNQMVNNTNQKKAKTKLKISESNVAKRNEPSEKESSIEQKQSNQPKQNHQKIHSNTKIACTICADSVKYCAVGECNHPICSKCACRIRIKSGDKSCALCKQYMEVMVVSKFSSESKSFQSFGISIDTVLPGVIIDQRSAMAFVDCPEHYNDILAFCAIMCPICKSRFPNDENLRKHVKDSHGLNYCKLCYEHRTLFPSEHRLLTGPELAAHMKLPAGSNDKYGFTGGHVLCKFCNQYNYDSMSLYNHMRTAHFNCHLCPIQYQHRFYKNIAELNKHLIATHYTCSICKIADAHSNQCQLISFATHNEYAHHMRDIHSVSNVSKNAHLAISYKSNRSKVDDADNTPYLDLNMNSSDPYRLEISSEFNPSSIPSQIHQIVPPNMRIAGRITGTGRFKRDSTDDEFEKYSEELQKKIDSAQRKSNLSNEKKDFPELSKGIEGSSGSGVTVHPLSILNSSRAVSIKNAKPTLSDQTDYVNQKRNSRSVTLANALGLEYRLSKDSLHDNTSEVTQLASFSEGFLYGMKCYKQRRQGSNVCLEDANIDDLLKYTLFPLHLLVWAKNCRQDMLVTEKKMQELIATPAMSSVQLKPMGRYSRESIVDLARYYELNAHEYNLKEKKYISLVKTLESNVPFVLLSSVTHGPVTTEETECLTEKMELEANKARLDKLSVSNDVYFWIKKGGEGLTIGSFLLEVKGIVESTNSLYDYDRISAISLIGCNLLKLSFSTESTAHKVYNCLIKNPRLVTEFDIIAGFDPEKPPPPVVYTLNRGNKDISIMSEKMVDKERFLHSMDDDDWHAYSEEYVNNLSDKWSKAFQSNNLREWDEEETVDDSNTNLSDKVYKKLNLLPRTIPVESALSQVSVKQAWNPVEKLSKDKKGKKGLTLNPKDAQKPNSSNAFGELWSDSDDEDTQQKLSELKTSKSPSIKSGPVVKDFIVLCPHCTLENDINNSYCEACEQKL